MPEETDFVLASTLHTLPNKNFQVLDLIFSHQQARGKINIEESLNNLKKQARDLGADAVIGIQMTMSQSDYGAPNFVLIGTPIRYK